jgi:hypothetical protein
VFVLKDRESAWRFARALHLTYFRERRLGPLFLLKADVVQ